MQANFHQWVPSLSSIEIKLLFHFPQLGKLSIAIFSWKHSISVISLSVPGL